jgi:hypothetical protein
VGVRVPLGTKVFLADAAMPASPVHGTLALALGRPLILLDRTDLGFGVLPQGIALAALPLG